MPDFPPVGTTPAEVWAYATRELTQAEFPFWSAIIDQQYGDVEIAGGAGAGVSIQPAVGETWHVWIDFYMGDPAVGDYVQYRDYDGAALNDHILDSSDGADDYPHLGVEKILTNDLYARVSYFNAAAPTAYGFYGYSGFKLSEPIWKGKRIAEPKVWKRKLSVEIPPLIEVLRPCACELFESRTRKYVPCIMLEEDTVLAVDPATKLPVETVSAFVKVDTLVAMLQEIKADPVKTGYDKYLRRWKAEGIEL